MDKNQLYSITLPNPNQPVYAPQPIIYMGTLNELEQFSGYLEKGKGAQYFHDVVDGIRNYHDNPNKTHRLQGHEEKVLTPVKEIGRKEFTLTDYEWTYISSATNTWYPLQGTFIWVSYILVETVAGVIRCDRAIIERPCVSVPGFGWIDIHDMNQGTPGMLHEEPHRDDKPHIVHMSLYRAAAHYPSSTSSPDTVDQLPGPLTVDLRALASEFFGQH